jgi:hypothetical protein
MTIFWPVIFIFQEIDDLSYIWKLGLWVVSRVMIMITAGVCCLFLVLELPPNTGCKPELDQMERVKEHGLQL